MVATATGWFNRLRLSSQFLVMAALVLCVSMAVLGTWVDRRITRSVLATTGADSAALMRALVEPEIQDMLPDGTLPERSHRALDAIFAGTPLGESIVSVKIWRNDQVVIYSSKDKDVIGKSFASTDVQKAFRSKIIAEFEDMVSLESAYEQTLDLPLIEVYAPIYRTGTDEIIAVGEFYDDARELASQLRGSQWRSWAVVFTTTMFMLLLLYWIVHRASSIIAAQREELRQSVDEARKMAEQNAGLRKVAEKTRLDANEANEELIGRIGLDLHDGPIQLLTLLMLRLDELRPSRAKRGGPQESAASIRQLTASVIQELRTLSTGLVLPEIGEMSVSDTIRLAVDRHENLTGTKVEVCLGLLPDDVTDAMKICLYRIVQESLTNSFRHAGGVGQKVEAWMDGGSIELCVSDKGEGHEPRAPIAFPPGKLGLRGIRNRVKAFGGNVEIRSEQGTEVRVVLPI